MLSILLKSFSNFSKKCVTYIYRYEFHVLEPRIEMNV